MKFDCGETLAEKYERQSQWHPWFAWFPVKVGSHDCRWLETVQRRRYVYFEYKGMEQP